VASIGPCSDPPPIPRLLPLQGLQAGFEVGEWLHSASDLKKEWEDFKRKQAQQKEEAATAIKGLYQCRVDATEPLRRGLHVRSIVVTNSVDATVGEADNLHVQGQAAVRNQAGSGNLIFGYTRQLSQHDSLDAQLVLGLRSLATLTSSRQIGTHTRASATLTWGPQEGVGMQLSSTRQMPHNCQGTFAWVLGPRGAPGMSLAVAQRGTKTALQGKVEVGAVTALSARATVMVTETVNVRAIVSPSSLPPSLSLPLSPPHLFTVLLVDPSPQPPPPPS
jgi:DnaJ family protein C protein 11